MMTQPINKMQTFLVFDHRDDVVIEWSVFAEAKHSDSFDGA